MLQKIVGLYFSALIIVAVLFWGFIFLLKKFINKTEIPITVDEREWGIQSTMPSDLSDLVWAETYVIYGNVEHTELGFCSEWAWEGSGAYRKDSGGNPMVQITTFTANSWEDAKEIYEGTVDNLRKTPIVPFPFDAA